MALPGFPSLTVGYDLPNIKVYDAKGQVVLSVANLDFLNPPGTFSLLTEDKTNAAAAREARELLHRSKAAHGKVDLPLFKALVLGRAPVEKKPPTTLVLDLDQAPDLPYGGTESLPRRG